MRLAPAAILLLLACPAFGEMFAPTNLPADRVIKNLKAKIQKTPMDAQIRYMLGRTYYSLFCAGDPRVIALYGTVAEPRFSRMHTSVWDFKREGLKLKNADATAISNAREAIRNLQVAVKIGGGELGLYQLTLACAFEATAEVQSKIEPGGAPFKKRALAAYEASFRESKAHDSKRKTGVQPWTYQRWISEEAGEGILRLDPKSKLAKEIAAHRKHLKSLPPGPITPLIFSLDVHRSLDDLLDTNKIVRFDLDGTGAPQKYSWVQPDTAFLVWQPRAGSKIRSGRQLFGSATWWLMPSNAYEAMALLDDNADGWLSGRELDSLAIWQDQNQNGIAETDEVVAVGARGATGLRTSFSGRVGESYVCTAGIRFSDGRLLPTYDWVTRSKE